MNVVVINRLLSELCTLFRALKLLPEIFMGQLNNQQREENYVQGSDSAPAKHMYYDRR